MAIIQAAFRNRNLANNSMWKTVVLIQKLDNRDLRGIGIIKVLWKTITGLIN